MQANTREEAKHQTKYSKNRDVLHGLIFKLSRWQLYFNLIASVRFRWFPELDLLRLLNRFNFKKLRVSSVLPPSRGPDKQYQERFFKYTR